METLSKNQKFVAMALTAGWQSSADIKKQATEDGANGIRNYGLDEFEPVQRVQWSKLVQFQIAEQHPENKWYRRGVKWQHFKDRHGSDPTQAGSDAIDIEKAIGRIFDQ